MTPGTGTLSYAGASYALSDVRIELYHCGSTVADWNFHSRTSPSHSAGRDNTRFDFSGTVERSIARVDDLHGAELELVDLEGDDADFTIDGSDGFVVATGPTRVTTEVADGCVTLSFEGTFSFNGEGGTVDHPMSLRAVARVVALWPGRLGAGAPG